MGVNTISNIISAKSRQPVHLSKLSWSSFNPLLHRYSFWSINNRQLLKTFWEKEKLLVTSNFSISHNVFYSIKTIVSPFVHILDIISLVALELEEPKIGISGKRLNITLHNGLSKSLAAFPHDYCWINGRSLETNESGHNVYHHFSKNISQAGGSNPVPCNTILFLLSMSNFDKTIL